jgi:RNA polymerase sigma-70 factor, ECF subfamily
VGHTAVTDASTDDQLMAALGAGDGASLAELVRRYQGPLVGYLAGIVNDVERARDLAQETFLRIYRHAAVYRETSRFTTWLFHIARNVARDELRARRRRPSLSGDELVIEGTAAPAQPLAERVERREVVVRALSELSERDRMLILLRDVQGCSYEEIAERTGMQLGTVKSGLNRARARFAERFGRL